MPQGLCTGGPLFLEHFPPLPPDSCVALLPHFLWASEYKSTFPGKLSDHSIQNSNPSYPALPSLFTLFYFCPEGGITI